ncbi:hypothetical protein, partial [Frankia sp. CiP3]|uniref:hypothetical protein n=1 Tax=Frankia sp. CiP3 TaxID=2880971 RepID=UPI001EF47F8A
THHDSGSTSMESLSPSGLPGRPERDHTPPAPASHRAALDAMSVGHGVAGIACALISNGMRELDA